MSSVRTSRGLQGRAWLALIAAVACALVLAVVFPIGRAVSAQSGISNPKTGMDRPEPNSRYPMQPPTDTEGGPGFQARRISALNQLRHKAMVDDADKLLLLARELNDDSANLSPSERLHKAAEIEKLAKSVKEKMSYSVSNNPVPTTYSITSP